MSRSFTRLRLPFTTLLILLLLAAPLLLPQTAQAAVFTVNSSGDADDANPGDGTCATSSGDCTLRAALQEANATPDEDTITFETLTDPIVLGGSALSITSTVTLNGPDATPLIIDGNASSPVFEITADATVTLNSLQIQNGRNANEQGGGIINAGTLIISSGVITGNVATQGGGGIFNNGGTVTLQNTLVSNNRTADATGTGGGIRSDGGTITVQGGAVRDNRAGTDGGGLFITNGQLRLTDTTIAGNQVLAGTTGQQRGGGVYYSGGDAVLTNAIIERNTTGQSGGGIHSDDGMTIVGGTFRNNTTTNPLAEGGGFWNGGGTVQITDTRFEQNRAEAQGGGLFLGTTSVVTLTNIVVTENRADEGAGIFNDRLQDQQAGARTLIVDSRIASNRADTSDVGGISGDGGGIYNNREAFLEIRASEVSGNIAAGDGAGLYNANGATMIVDAVLVSGNQTELVALSGGGQNFVDDEQDGGGIYSLENTTLTVRNSTIRDNVAGGYGGGIARFTVAGELEPSTFITNTIIENNTALGQKQIGNSRPDGGGGLWLGASSVLSDVIIRNNRAPLGGGVIVTFEDTTFEDVTLIGNTAFVTETIAGDQVVRDPQSGIGGGIYFDVEGQSELALSRTLIAGNTSEDIAGGIYAADPRLSLTNVTLDGNQSVGEGAAFYKTTIGVDVEGEPRITFTNVTVSDNNASSTDATDGLFSEGGFASLTNVLLANGDGSRNCNVLTRDFAFASQGGNLDSGTSCAFAEQGNATDQSSVDPLLGALADNGGTTRTRALLAGSPAIDAGISTAEACPPTDQRGIARPQGAACDIGAFEVEGTAPPQNVAPQSLTITGAETGEVNTAYRFTATVAPTDTTTPLTYTWQASQQQPITTTGNLSNQQQFTWDTAGTQQITVTAANALGVVTGTFTIEIQEAATPTAPQSLTITGAETGEVNTAYRFTATVAPTDTTTPLTYTWQASQQQPITTTGNLSNQQQFTWDTAGTQQITVTAANALGVVTGTFSITIQEPPTQGNVLTPNNPAVLTPTETLLFQFSADAVTETTRITYTGTTEQSPPTSPTTQTLRRFTLEAATEQGAPVTRTQQVYTGTITLTSGELAELGDDLSGLQVQRWNGSAWEVIASQPVTTTRLAAGNAIQYTTSAFGQFVLTAPVQDTTRRVYLPLIVRQQL